MLACVRARTHARSAVLGLVKLAMPGQIWGKLKAVAFPFSLWPRAGDLPFSLGILPLPPTSYPTLVGFIGTQLTLLPLLLDSIVAAVVDGPDVDLQHARATANSSRNMKKHQAFNRSIKPSNPAPRVHNEEWDRVWGWTS